MSRTSVPVVTHFIHTEHMRKINTVHFQGQRGIKTDGLALVLFCEVEAETQRGNNILAPLLWAINNLFLTHYLPGCRKIGSSTVSGSPQRLLGAGEDSVCRRCSRSGTLPGCLFDQAAGTLTELHTISGKKHTKAIRWHDSHEDEDFLGGVFGKRSSIQL